MSFPQYGKLWIATTENLKNVVMREKVLPQLEPTRDRIYAHRLVGNIYARYIVLCNNLSELYDQTLQVQKRDVIERILMSSTKRLLELQQEMQKIEMSEFVYLDDELVELKLTPANIEFLRPFYFPRKRDIEVQQIVDEVPRVSKASEIIEAPKGLDKYRKILTPEELEAKKLKAQMERAVTLIKAHEKAKQARIYWLNIKMFPDKFQPRPHSKTTVDYNFIHQPDQIPLHKIKRSNYKTDFFKPKVNVAKFTFYAAPTYRINRLGQKVIVSRKKSETVKTQIDDESESEEDDVEKVEELNRWQAQRDAEVQKQRDRAAFVIQRSFRNFQQQKALEKRKWQQLKLCGLVQAPDDPDKPNQKLIDDKMQSKRRERKKEFDECFIKALEDEKARILKVKSHFIMEDISDDIRQWFHEFYKGAKDFHRYPEEFEGGTIMVMRGETSTVEEFVIEKSKTPAQKAKEKAERRKAKKEEKKNKKKQEVLEKKAELEKRKLELKQGPTWDFADKKHESENLNDLEKNFADYQRDWMFIDETSNRTEAPVWDWVTIDAYADVHKELRLIVDDFMRIELELLRVALAVERKTKYVPPKHKKPKKEKKKNRKPSVDVTEGRSLEECYDELKSLNIIRKYTKRSMDDFIADEYFAASELRKMNKNPPPSYGDVKNSLRSMVLGMGPLELPKVKTLCIAGPRNCGKKLLVDALCTEMNAVMFDLSAKNVAPIVDMIEFLALVMQMAKKLQPTVIFIDGAHKPFIRIMSDEEQFEFPRKLGRFLLRYVVKKLSSDDAVMLISTTNQPWNCNYFQLRQCFEKVVIFPPLLDYGTALMTWNKGLQSKRVYNFNASPLAQVTRKYTVGDILDLIDDHVDLQRRMNFQLKPLTCDELLEGLLESKKAIDEQTLNNFKSFASKTDSFYYERSVTMARVQEQIDKEKEAQAKRLEMLKKKKLKQEGKKV